MSRLDEVSRAVRRRLPCAAGRSKLGFLPPLALGAAWLLAVGAGPASADPPKPPEMVGVEVGLSGAYRLGFWTPVTITLRGGDERATGVVELSAIDGDEVPVIYRSAPLLLLPGQIAATTLYIRLGSSAELGVVLRGESEVLFRGKLENANYDGGPFLPGPLSPSDRLIISVGANPTLKELRFKDRDGDDDRRPTLVGFDDPARLPTKRVGYDAVDCVVLRADRLSRYGTLPSDAPQWSALRTWVELGGKLVIVAGPDVETLLASGGPLASLFPVEAEGMTSLPRTTALEDAAGNRRLNLDAETLAQLRVLRIRETDGDVELAEGNLPLVVRRAVGLGRVTFAAVDLEHNALKDWSPRQRLIKQLIENVGVPESSEESTSTAGNFGYNDIAGQLRAGLDQYENVQVISFFALAMLVLAYIALVGPGDFLLVRKVLRRTELTWVTLPAIVLLTTLGAHYLAVWMKGNELRTNQVDVVDCDAKSGVVRGVSYVGVFSPSNTQYDVTVRLPEKLLGSPPVRPEVVTTWLGLPGDGFAGMNRNDGGGDLFTRPYETSGDLSSLSGMPVKVWSSKQVSGRWSARAPKPLHAPLILQGDRPTGAVRNPFAAPLVEAWLFYGSDAYKIGELAPGKSVEVRGLVGQSQRSVLNDTQILASTKQHQTPRYQVRPYDHGSLNIGYIVRQMMFFEAAGGQGRTSLQHRYQEFLDADELLALNRAVLVAQVANPAEFGPQLSLEVGGEQADRNHDNRYMFVRLMIPVESAAP